jgi:hypothetical protein
MQIAVNLKYQRNNKDTLLVCSLLKISEFLAFESLNVHRDERRNSFHLFIQILSMTANGRTVRHYFCTIIGKLFCILKEFVY